VFELDRGRRHRPSVLAEEPEVRDERAGESKQYAELNHLSENLLSGRGVLRSDP
jgi:hypothetical protein